MSSIWMLCVEDEHGYTGGALSVPCATKEIAIKYAAKHFTNGSDYYCVNAQSNIGIIRDGFLTTPENYESDLREYESRVGLMYSDYQEYGGRFYIEIFETSLVTE